MVKARLYLDMNIYNRPFDDQNQMRIQLETRAITMLFALIEQKQYVVTWSFVLDYENSRNPFPERRTFVQHLAQVCDKTIEPNRKIKKNLAETLSQTHQIRGRDALHLACAEYSGCDCLLTCDDRLVRRGQRLQREGVLTVTVINPIDLLRQG